MNVSVVRNFYLPPQSHLPTLYRKKFQTFIDVSLKIKSVILHTPSIQTRSDKTQYEKVIKKIKHRQ